MNRNQDNVNRALYEEAETEDVSMEELYQKEIDRLLEARPEMVEYQKEIQRRLSHAGSFQNRMAVLGIMMEDKLKQLQHHLTCLADQVQTKMENMQ